MKKIFYLKLNRFPCLLLGISLFLSFNLKVTSQIEDQIKTRDEKWREDLSYLVQEMPKVHKNLFHEMTKEQLDNFVTSLDKNIPALTDNQVIAQFVKLVAMIGDGHTSMQLPSFHVYPIQTYIFKDGQYVIGADDKYKELIGMKLIKIGDKYPDEIHNILKPYIHRDNEMQIKSLMPLDMQVAEMLNGTGIISDVNKAAFTFEDSEGNHKTVIFEPVEFKPYLEKIQNLPVPDGVPLYQSNPKKYYWFTYLENSKTLYFQYNTVLIDPEDSTQDFIKRLDDFVSSHEINRFVVDIRNNSGGNLFTSKPFTAFIRDNSKINQRGKLFVIIGRRTFSAASFFTSSLEYQTKAIFFGEPTGATPNHFGDNKLVKLPNSGFEARLSTRYWQNSFPFDNRQWTAPDILIELTSKDYFAKKDPVMEAILKYQPEDVKQVNISDDVMKKIIGRYDYDPEKVMEIKETNGLLKMTITDFINTSLYPVSQEKLVTDITGVFLKPELSNNYESITINAFGNKKEMKKLPENYMLPIELIYAGKYDEALERYRKIKDSNPDFNSVSEDALNQLGYDLMARNDYNAALVIFKLNVEFYPGSFNTYDSLGEAYMNIGDKELAIKNYEKSIELNPENENGKKMLEKLHAN